MRLVTRLDRRTAGRTLIWLVTRQASGLRGGQWHRSMADVGHFRDELMKDVRQRIILMEDVRKVSVGKISEKMLEIIYEILLLIVGQVV